MTDTANPVTIAARRTHVRTQIALASRVLPTYYPLRTFIAVNPLAGLERMPFEQAIHRAGDLYGIRGVLPLQHFRALHRDGRITDDDLDSVLRRRCPGLLDGPAIRFGTTTLTPIQILRADLLHGHPTPDPVRRSRMISEVVLPHIAGSVDDHTVKWCAAFIGADSAGWPMPDREHGFYAAWRALAWRDPALGPRVRTALRAAPVRADDAVLDALDALDIGDENRIACLQAHLTRLPGWAAHVRWHAENASGIDVTEYLAVRLTYESALLAEAAPGGAAPVDDALPTVASARQRAVDLTRLGHIAELSESELASVARVLAALPATAREMVWQQAYEHHYQRELLAALAGAQPAPAELSRIQVVTCIDTRSEGLRRHLETRPGVETLGFAGFFAVAIRFTDLLGGAPNDLCPVLISPDHLVSELPAPGAGAGAGRRMAGMGVLAAGDSAIHTAEQTPAAPFTLAEAAGWAAGPWATVKTLAPRVAGALRRRARDIIAPPADTVLSVNDSVSLDQRVLFAHAALTTMGLTRDFARLVVMCAHTSRTENNPYQAALDCGACGGQPGDPNARTAASILNNQDVRTELRQHGINIPDDTWFLAALHDTAVDEVSVLERHLIPPAFHGDIERLEEDLRAAGRALAAQRCALLPGAPRASSPKRAARHVRVRSADWAQVYPEWALAGNAAFIVGPRSLTRGVDLRCRTFLHSYDADIDADGGGLEIILTAPLVVAQWINSQYYFSTVAPDVFGAGTKTIHNVVGTAGVIAGYNSDLKLGLPWQSIADGARLMHEPMRLLAVVQAPLERIDMIIDRNPILQQLFGNDWVALTARNDSVAPWHRWTHAGWQPNTQTLTAETQHETEISL
ncbi:DUF2309 domain-containing protein [Mycobacterium sp.]|uniref:DUF2309 domain-containing protein n=1 Tax=Mycobacterium sp. TaxID=1785 RepID=UPI0031E3ABC7